MLIRFYKPYGVLCQFRDSDGRPTLATFVREPRVHAAGRLDFDSEGLLLLTDEGALQARITEPRYKLPKTYLAQVEATPDLTAFGDLAHRLREGVALRDGPAYAVSVRQVPAPTLPMRDPGVTPHRAARSSWVEIVLTEGRNRQVRRMLAAVGMPVLRLVRIRIGPFGLDGLQPGDREIIPVPDVLRIPQARPKPPDRTSITRPGGRRSRP